MDEATAQILACAAWGAIAVLLALFCLNLLVIMVGEAREAADPAREAQPDADEFASAPELTEVLTTNGGTRLRFDALTALVSVALLLSPAAAGASLAAAWFAPAWMRAAAGATTLLVALVAGRGALLDALERAGVTAPGDARDE